MKRYLPFILAGAGVLFFSFFAHAQIIAVTIPSVPQGFVATTTGPSDVALSWNASVESSGEIAGYTIYRNSRLLASTTATSYSDSGIAPGLYTYTVGALDTDGNLSPGESAPQTILISSTIQPPTAPTGLTAIGTLFTNNYSVPASVTISWNPSIDNFGVAGYLVQRNGAPVNSTSTLYTTTSMTDSLLPGNYSYTVTAYDADQDASPLSATLDINIGLYVTPPSVPANVSVLQTAPDGIMLSWATSTDAVGIAGYQIYQNGTQIATVSSSPYVGSGLATGMPYSYQVAAYDNAGNVSVLSSGLAQITLQDNYTPSVPLSTSTTESVSSSSPVSSSTSTSISTLLTTGVPGISSLINALFTQSLYVGLRSQQVQTLQSVLAEQGYLLSQYETGFFGSLTLHAVQQFQCAKGIVCAGGAGWGIVGPKTRGVLNGLDLKGSVASTSTVSTTASTESVAAEIQALQAELTSLEKQR